MGLNIVFSWFGKSLDELKVIREKNVDILSKEELEKLDKIITEKENEEK